MSETSSSEQSGHGSSKRQLTDKVSLTPANDDDTEFARNAHHRAYRGVVVDQFGEWDEARQDKFFELSWANPGFEIAHYDGQPCGYLRIENLPDQVRAHELTILPEFQGRGIGTTLLHEIQGRATQRGVPIRLQVLKANRAAELYERVGFKPVGETDTHTVMEWRQPQPQ